MEPQLSLEEVYEPAVPYPTTNPQGDMPSAISNYTQRCPVRLFDIYDMKMVSRSQLYDFIYQSLIQVPPSMDPWHVRIERIAKYAMLSHRWTDAEINISDMPAFIAGRPIEGKEMSQKKLDAFFRAAGGQGYRFVWFDSGCIDQSNGPEVEESIRCMFRWYRHAHVCIVNLDRSAPSSWYTRGWTLQELLAPKRLQFYDSYFHVWRRGTTLFDVPDCVYDVDRINKTHSSSILSDISRRTGIDEATLTEMINPGPHHAVRIFGYMHNRQTTRPEDMAYCLISLLDIHMPISYGEGFYRAFYRLQVACLQESPSRSLFHWTGSLSTRWNSLLAQSPWSFDSYTATSARTEHISFDIFDPSSQVDVSFTINNSGIRIMMCLFDLGTPSIMSTVKRKDTSPTETRYSLCLLGGSRDTLLHVNNAALEKEISELAIGIYGWVGQVSYGVVLRKGNTISRAGYAREFAVTIEKLPETSGILQSDTKPQWVYVK